MPVGTPNDAATTSTLSEHDSKNRVRAYGVATAPERLVDSPTAAVEAARELGFPVVVKANAPGLAHKTERGLVRVGLGDPQEVLDAAGDLLERAASDAAAAGLLVGSMVSGSRELIAGLSLDPTFGMCVMCGIGGIFTEALADVAFRLVPITRIDAFDMLDQLEHQALLGDVRGETALDRNATAEVLLALSRLAVENPDVVSADLNPLIVDAAGQPICVDALIEVGS